MEIDVINSKEIIREIMEGCRMNAVCKKYNLSFDMVRRMLADEGLYYDEIREQMKYKWEAKAFEAAFELYNRNKTLPLPAELKKVIPPQVSANKLYATISKRGFDFNNLPAREPEPEPEQKTLFKTAALTAENIIEDIKRIYTLLNRKPRAAEVRALSLYNKLSYDRFFGGYSSAINHLDILKFIRGLHDKEVADKINAKQQVLLDYLHIKAKELGRTPMKKDMLIDKVHPYMQYYRCFGSIKQAIVLAGIKPVQAERKAKTEEIRNAIIEEAKQLYNQLQRQPLPDEIDQLSKFGTKVYFKHFRNLNHVFKEAGFEIAQAPRFSNETVLDYLRQKAQENGGAISIPILKKTGSKYSHVLYARRFGSWNKALVAAGLKTNIEYTQHTAQELIVYLQQLGGKLGRAPRPKDVLADKKTFYVIIRRCFGNFRDALIAAGFTVSDLKMSVSSQQDVIDYMVKLSAQIERTPRIMDVMADKKISCQKINKYFGTFTGALTAAGFKRNQTKQTRFTQQNIIDYLKNLAAKIQKTPRIKDVIADKKISCQTIVKYCGSFTKAITAAGLPLNRTRQSTFTQDDVIDYLKNLAVQLQRTPQVKEVMADKKIPYQAVLRCFGSFAAALAVAGLPRNYTKQSKFTQQDIIDYLKSLAAQIQKTPQVRDVIADKKIPYPVILKSFGSMHAALAVAELRRGRK